MRTVLNIVLFFTVTACSPAFIPGTVVEDTESNRGIYDVVETYRKAMEKRDVRQMGKIISRKYYENSSTTDENDDDYGYATVVEKVLPKLKDNIKKVQYRILLRSVTVIGDRAMAEYEYFWKFLYSEGGRENWVARNDFNRLDFIREDGAWKIVAGL